MKTTIFTIAVLSLLGGSALAQPGQDKGHKPSHTKPASSALVCPVTGDKIASVKAAKGHSAYKGKTYYFCCDGCKPRFDKDPAKFVKNAAAHKYEKM